MPQLPTRDELFDENFLRRLRHLAMIGRRMLSPACRGGAHRATDLGDGLEFADHRDYSPGDELRYVDWNVFARLGRVQVRLFHRHSELQVHLLPDCSGSMAVGSPSKGLYAKRCAAALAYLGWINLDHVHVVPLAGPGKAASELAPLRGRAGRFGAVLDYLADMPMGGPGELADSARRWLSRSRPRGLAIILSDAPDTDDLSAALQPIRHAGHQVALLHIYSPADAGNAPPGPLCLVDPERSCPPLRLLNDPTLAAAYRARWEAYLSRLRSSVRSVSGLYAHTATDQPWEKFLISCLRLLRMATV